LLARLDPSVLGSYRRIIIFDNEKHSNLVN